MDHTPIELRMCSLFSVIAREPSFLLPQIQLPSSRLAIRKQVDAPRIELTSIMIAKRSKSSSPSQRRNQIETKTPTFPKFISVLREEVFESSNESVSSREPPSTVSRSCERLASRFFPVQ